jgi:hypothetical protein
LSNLLNLYKKYDVQISKRHLYMWKKLINRLLDFSGVLYNFEINCTYLHTCQNLGTLSDSGLFPKLLHHYVVVNSVF